MEGTCERLRSKVAVLKGLAHGEDAAKLAAQQALTQLGATMDEPIQVVDLGNAPGLESSVGETSSVGVCWLESVGYTRRLAVILVCNHES